MPPAKQHRQIDPIEVSQDPELWEAGPTGMPDLITLTTLIGSGPLQNTIVNVWVHSKQLYC